MYIPEMIKVDHAYVERMVKKFGSAAICCAERDGVKKYLPLTNVDEICKLAKTHYLHIVDENKNFIYDLMISPRCNNDIKRMDSIGKIC